MACVQFLLAVAGGVPSFKGGYLEEEKRRSVYVDFESDTSTVGPIDTTLSEFSAGYGYSFGGGRTGSCPAAFVDVAGQCSSFQAGILVREVEVASVTWSELAMLTVRYAARSPDGFAFFAEGDLGRLEEISTDTQIQLGVGAGSGTGVSEIRVMVHVVDFTEDTSPLCRVLLVESVSMTQPSSENWVLLGARWKHVDVDNETARDTATLSLWADWYPTRDAYVGFELSLADCETVGPYYRAPPVGLLGKYTGYRIRGGYEGEDLAVSAWFEPRTRESADEFAWGLSAAYKF